MTRCCRVKLNSSGFLIHMIRDRQVINISNLEFFQIDDLAAPSIKFQFLSGSILWMSKTKDERDEDYDDLLKLLDTSVDTPPVESSTGLS